MQVVLFRHAERESLGMGNPHLTARGMRQARQIAELVKSQDLPAPTRLLITNRIRTLQTLEPLAELTGLAPQLTPDLSERIGKETREQFRSRIGRFLNFLEKQSGVIYLCSHLDWIDESLTLIPSSSDLAAAAGGWAPAQFMVFDIHEGLWHLTKQGRIYAGS